MTVADKLSLKLGLIWMLIVFMALYAGFEMAPFELGAFKGNFVRPDFKPTHAMELALQTWDAQHYLFLAEHGYQAGHQSSAFYPLYPLLVSLLAWLFGSAWIMACALSAVCAITGLVLFRKTGARLKTEAPTQDSTAEERLPLSSLLLLCFPSAFFMYLPYSEAMFFCLASGWILALLNGQTRWACAAALLLPLIRPLGLFLTVPTLVYLFQQRRRQRQITPDQLALLLAPIIGFGIYLLWMQASTDDFLTGFKVQRFYISHRSVASMFMPWKLVMAFFSEGLLLHHFTLSIIDRLMFVFFVVAAAVSYRRLPLFVWVFAVTMGLTPALSGSFMSYSRYALMIFPLFWGLELWAGSSSTKRGIILFFLSTALLLQGFFILRHVNALWAA